MNNRSLKFKNIEASSQGSNWKFGQLKNNSHAVNKPFDALFNPGNPYVQMISFWLFNLRNKMLKIIIFSNDKWYSNISSLFYHFEYQIEKVKISIWWQHTLVVYSLIQSFSNMTNVSRASPISASRSSLCLLANEEMNTIEYNLVVEGRNKVISQVNMIDISFITRTKGFLHLH